MKDTRFSKLVLFVNALVPLALLLWDTYHKNVGANPLEFVTRTTGMLTLVFLFLTLAVTPARKITGLNWLVNFRRMLGLFAFFYASLHLATYIALYMNFDLNVFKTDITKRRFIIMGFSAWLLLLPLAATSTTWAIRKLGGKRWNRLHKLVYFAAVSGIVHYWWQVKPGVLSPMRLTIVLFVLFLARPVLKLVQKRKARPVAVS